MSPEGFLKEWVIIIGYFDDQSLNVVDQARASMHDAFFTQNLFDSTVTTGDLLILPWGLVTGD
jgi:hypothetical protein